MPSRTADCVWQSTDTVGTGTLTLGAAVTGYRSLADAVAANDLNVGSVVPYRIEAVDGAGNPSGLWETGEGTVGTGGATLSRDSVRASSSGGTPVNFPVGPKLVFLTEEVDPLTITFGWNNASPRTIGVVPAGMTITSVRLILTTAFSNPSSTLSVGTALNPTQYMSPAQCELTAVAEFETTPLVVTTAPTTVILTISSPPGEVSGVGTVEVDYEPTSLGG